MDAPLKLKLESAMDSVSKHVDDFVDVLETLEGLTPDESVQYRKALDLLAKRGVTATDLVCDFDACLGALDQEERTFVSELQARLDQEVGGRQKSVQQMDADIAKMEAELRQLRERREADQASIAVSESKLTAVRSRYVAVCGRLRATVSGQKDRVLKYGDVK